MLAVPAGGHANCYCKELVMFLDMRTLPSRDRPNVFRKPPERAEYTTESEVEESELDQTRHNRCELLRPTAYSDSDRLVDISVIFSN